MSYIKLTVVRETEKTTIWNVSNSTNEAHLGIIKWYGAWRKYCFFPALETIFDNKCLEKINSYLITANKYHKEK